MVVNAKRMSADDLSLLWGEYKHTGSTELRNRLVELYLWLVKSIVNRLMGKTFAKFIGRDEVEAAGNWGLIQAVEGYELERGIKFETYATTRIRGAILDWLREIDWVPRKARSNAKLYSEAISAIQSGTGQQPTIEEVAEFLHVSPETAQSLQKDAEGASHHFQQQSEYARGDEDTFRQPPAFDQMADRRTVTPFEELTKSDRFDELVGCLTDTEQIIVTLYYRDEFTMLRIGTILGFSESRISQMHDRALLKIKDSLS